VRLQHRVQAALTCQSALASTRQPVEERDDADDRHHAPLDFLALHLVQAHCVVLPAGIARARPASDQRQRRVAQAGHDGHADAELHQAVVQQAAAAGAAAAPPRLPLRWQHPLRARARVREEVKSDLAGPLEQHQVVAKAALLTYAC